MPYKNPIPVVVGLVFPEPEKLLLVRRKIEPHIGGLALPGGYVEVPQDWREALNREILEEAMIMVSTDPKHMRVFEASSTPDGERLLLFAVIKKEGIVQTFKFRENDETSERLTVPVSYYSSPQLCFPLHTAAVNRYREMNFTFEGAHPGGW
jgi:ADP-ribose pyrophosphatase YjhB (NUDIX family)